MVYGECLKAIGQRFDNELVKIDTSLSEPEQIIRLWGTWNRRDPETEGRPHRQSRILEKARGTVSLAQLGMLELEYRAPAKEHDKSPDFCPRRRTGGLEDYQHLPADLHGGRIPRMEAHGKQGHRSSV